MWKSLSSCAFLGLTLGLLTGCADFNDFGKAGQLDPIDRKLGLTRKDYRSLDQSPVSQDGKRETGALQVKEPPVPDLAPILAAPRPPKITNTKLVSVTVTDDVPLKDVLIELARLADVDIELDAGIQGGISFRAKERPFNEVVARIADLAGLRYSMKNGVLRVERDIPYIKNYNLDFLNMVRGSESTVTVSTDILSLATSASSGGEGGGGGGGAAGLSTGSTSTISSAAEDDFWESLEVGVREILSYQPQQRLSSGIAAVPDPATAATPAVDPAAAGAGAAVASGAVAGATAGAAGGAAGAAGANSNRTANGGFFVINRQAGILSISASEQQHVVIRTFIDRLRSSATAQVLIEAKIVEVELEDEFRSGIDWSLINGDVNIGTTFGPDFEANNVITTVISDGQAGNLDVAVDLLERFGTTRTLSSPRLNAINNQQAVLTFAENRVFFDIDIEREDDTITTGGQIIPGTTTIETTRHTIPIGIILNILPSIDIEDNEVTLNVRPTLSRQVDTVIDPGSALANQIIINQGGAGFTSEIPVVEVRELDSILKIKSGQIMVIGGLMEQTSTNEDTGVPYLSRIPLIGNAFKSSQKRDSTRELIIFIRATIINPGGNYQKADERIYNTFTRDPRPLAF